jgi:alkylation response protein AidB-like acyl-CoA dehydrogenase
MRDMFARFLDQHSSIERVRAALPTGFDASLWRGLAEQGAFGIRVPEPSGGLGLGIFDACLLMEEAGRTLVSGPLAETLVSAGLLARLAPHTPPGERGLLDSVLAGDTVLVMALHDAAEQPGQLVPGGAVADAVIVREQEQVFLLRPADQPGRREPTLASTPIARLSLQDGERTVLGQGEQDVAAWQAALEEWKLLLAAALTGLAREALRLASEYACERGQFGRPIGAYQAVSHPLANCVVDVDAGRLLTWRAIRSLADRAPDAAAGVSTAAWWACVTAEKSVAHALHTFGGYGLTLEYDIHLFNLRAKAWPLVYGDPARLLDEAAARRYGGETVPFPDAGEVPVEFGLGAEAGELAAETRAFFDEHLTPELREKAHYSFSGHDPGIHRKLAQRGLLFPAWPRHMGGREASPYAVQAVLQVWHDNDWTTHAQATDNIVGYIMDRFGTDELKAQALARVAAGEACCALGFSEPGSGSDVFAATTRARRDGEQWVVEGQKMFTSGAEIADYVLLLARTDPDAPKHRGLTMFIVPLDSEGVTIHPVHTFQDERTNVTFYDGVRIPDSYRLGEEGGGLRVLVSSLEIEHAMTFVKEHERLLRAAERFCRNTHRDTRDNTRRNGRAMIEDRAVQRRLARSAAHVAASEVLNYRALWAASEGRQDAAVGPASKLFSSEVYGADARDLLNLAAPESLAFASRDAAYINWCYRHSQVATVYGGTSEIHRSMVAERVLGLPRTRD